METNDTDQSVCRTSTWDHRRLRSAALLAVLVAFGMGVAACGGSAGPGACSRRGWRPSAGSPFRLSDRDHAQSWSGL